MIRFLLPSFFRTGNDSGSTELPIDFSLTDFWIKTKGYKTLLPIDSRRDKNEGKSATSLSEYEMSGERKLKDE